MSGNAVRLSESTLNWARKEARVMSRSLSGQVEHWVRLGRALEKAEGFSYERVRLALSGQGSLDDLSADEKALFDASHEVLMQEPSAKLEKHFEQMRQQDAADGFDTSTLGY